MRGPEPWAAEVWRSLRAFREHDPDISGTDLYRTLADEVWRRWRGVPAPPPDTALEVDEDLLVELKEVTQDLLLIHALVAVGAAAKSPDVAEVASWALGRAGVAPGDLYRLTDSEGDRARLVEVVDRLWQLPCKRCGRSMGGRHE